MSPHFLLTLRRGNKIQRNPGPSSLCLYSPVLGIAGLPLNEVLVHDPGGDVPGEHHVLRVGLVASDPEAGGGVASRGVQVDNIHLFVKT